MERLPLLYSALSGHFRVKVITLAGVIGSFLFTSDRHNVLYRRVAEDTVPLIATIRNTGSGIAVAPIFALHRGIVIPKGDTHHETGLSGK